MPVNQYNPLADQIAGARSEFDDDSIANHLAANHPILGGKITAALQGGLSSTKILDYLGSFGGTIPGTEQTGLPGPPRTSIQQDLGPANLPGAVGDQPNKPGVYTRRVPFGPPAVYQPGELTSVTPGTAKTPAQPGMKPSDLPTTYRLPGAGVADTANKFLTGALEDVVEGAERTSGAGTGAKLGGTWQTAEGIGSLAMPSTIRAAPEILNPVRLAKWAQGTKAAALAAVKNVGYRGPIKAGIDAFKAAVEDPVPPPPEAPVPFRPNPNIRAKTSYGGPADPGYTAPNPMPTPQPGRLAGPPPEPAPAPTPPTPFKPNPNIQRRLARRATGDVYSPTGGGPAPRRPYRAPAQPSSSVQTGGTGEGPPIGTTPPEVPKTPPGASSPFSTRAQEISDKYIQDAAAKEAKLAKSYRARNVTPEQVMAETDEQSLASAKQAGFRNFAGKPEDIPARRARIADLMRGLGAPEPPDVAPDVPHLAEGGIVNKPTVALIGEAGPEMRVPLAQFRRTADQATMPEKQETMQAQMGQLVSGIRKAVMFARGTNVLPRPKGMKSYQDGAGNTYIYNPQLISQPQIDDAISSNKLPSILGPADGGMGVPDKTKLAGPRAAVVGRGPDGQTTQSTLADVGNVDGAVAQTAKVTPVGGKVSVEHPAKEIAARTKEPSFTSGERIRGSIDAPLDEEGLKQADYLGQRIAAKGGVHRIIAGDLTRTQQTAAGIKKYNPQAGVTVTRALEPWPTGALEGQPAEDVLPELRRLVYQSPAEVPRGMSPESTRSPQSFNRVKERILNEVARRHAERKRTAPNETWLLQTHKTALRLIQAWVAKGAKPNLDIDKDVYFRGDSDKPGSYLTIDLDTPRVLRGDLENDDQLGPNLLIARHGETALNTKRSNDGKPTGS
jgi:broad specificity phosphatase PhoE